MFGSGNLIFLVLEGVRNWSCLGRFFLSGSLIFLVLEGVRNWSCSGRFFE